MHPTLYKKDSTGAIRQWHIEENTDGNGYRMVSGQLHGQLVASDFTICTPVNVGKKNQRDPVQQCAFEIDASYKKKRKEGYHDTVELAQTTAMHFFEPMLAEKFKDYEMDIPWHIPHGVIVQPKLDGIRCIARAGDLRTRTGDPIPSCGHIAMAMGRFNHTVIFDGELYNHDLKEDFEEISSLVRKTKNFEKHQEKINSLIQYHIYDMFIVSAPETPFAARYAHLVQLLDSLPESVRSVVKLVETKTVHTQAEMDEEYDRVLDEGYEGQMVRSNTPYENKRTPALLKRKEWITEEFRLVDVLEGKGNRAGMAGKVLLTLADGRTFKAGIKGKKDYYRYLLAKKEQFIGQLATHRFVKYSADGIPSHGAVIDIGRTDV